MYEQATCGGCYRTPYKKQVGPKAQTQPYTVHLFANPSYIRATTPTMRFLLFACCCLLWSNASGQFFLNGDATMLNDSCFQLTSETNWQVGSIWNPDKIDLRRSFDLVMEVFPGCDDEGADGLVFGLQPISTSIGTSGEDLGFGGVVPSLGVEIDTYFNGNKGDPEFDHLAIISPLFLRACWALTSRMTSGRRFKILSVESRG